MELFQEVERGGARLPIWKYDSCECILHTLMTSYLLCRKLNKDQRVYQKQEYYTETSKSTV